MQSRIAVGAAAGLIALLTACGGETSTPSDGDMAGVGVPRAGSVVQLAQCRDWLEGSVEERFATIEDIRAGIGSQPASGEPPLSDLEAYDLFERACSNDFAAGFRLYKIYYRAAAFQSLAR